MTNPSIPSDLKPFFWDVDFSELSTSKHAKFIIERLLEKGTWPAIKWLYHNFDCQNVLDVLDNSHNISSATKHLWNDVRHIMSENDKTLHKHNYF